MATDLPASDKWPGVEHAYDFVVPSYQWAITRFEAADSRIQSLLTLVVTVSLGVPALASNLPGARSGLMSSFLIAAALLFAVAALVFGSIGRFGGTLRLADPGKMWTGNWLKKPEWAFKKDMLSFSAEHFDQNIAAIEQKYVYLKATMVMFGAELVLMVLWIVL